MSPITQDEAREALANIDKVARQTRRAVAGSNMGNCLLIGGAMWGIGFTLNYLFPAWTHHVWAVLSTVGLTAMALLGLAHHRRGEVRSLESQRVLGQVALFWLAIMAYLITLCIALPLRHWADQLVLIVTLLMLAYVLMGIWLRTPILCFIGLTVTVGTLVGRSCLPPQHFLLWMAVFGGGGLFLPGLYVKLRWK